MKLKEIEALCGNFEQTRNSEGRLTCANILPGDVCRLPNHFDCDVKRRQRSTVHTTSTSKVQEWFRCRRSWAFRYYWKVSPPKEADWKIVGREFANARARIDYGLPWQIPDLKTTHPVEDKAKLEWILGEYAKLPRSAEKSEVKTEAQLGGGVVLIGYADGYTDPSAIYEWKYARDPDTYSRCKLSLQASSYLAGLPSADEFHLCVAKKSGMSMYLATPEEKRRRKKDGSYYENVRLEDETPEQFKQRLGEVTEDIFAFRTFLRAEFDIEGNLRLMAQAHEEYTEAVKTGRFPPNYSQCEDCDWKDVCEDHVVFGKDTEHCELCAIMARKGA